MDKLVNGVRVEMSQEEIFTIQAEWEANENLVVVPAEISKVQLVRACRELDLWDSYKALFEADPDWEYITSVPRDNSTLNANANAQLGEQTAQALLDQVFILGATK